jgi:ABC-type uncharacterized transport system auxiliary subunit
VRVLPFGIATAYDSQSFLYRSGAYDVGIDYYNRWVGNPAHMITDLVVRDLAASKTVTAVVQTPSVLPADYELSGHIETLEERDEGSACTAHLRLRIVLDRVSSQGHRYVVLQEGFTADAPCTPGDPESYAAAMSNAVQRVSDQIRAALLTGISADADLGLWTVSVESIVADRSGAAWRLDI